jgi:hypothetical protein
MWVENLRIIPVYEFLSEITLPINTKFKLNKEYRLNGKPLCKRKLVAILENNTNKFTKLKIWSKNQTKSMFATNDLYYSPTPKHRFKNKRYYVEILNDIPSRT